MGKPLAGGWGTRQEAALFLLGASWALDPFHHSCREWRPIWSGAKVGRPRRGKGPGLHLPGKKMYSQTLLSTERSARHCAPCLTCIASSTPQTQSHEMMTVIIPVSQTRKPRYRALQSLVVRQGLGGMDLRPPATRGALRSSQKPDQGCPTEPHRSHKYKRKVTCILLMCFR